MLAQEVIRRKSRAQALDILREMARVGRQGIVNSVLTSNPVAHTMQSTSYSRPPATTPTRPC